MPEEGKAVSQSLPWLEEYARYIRLERGLSSNTVEAYLSDLRQWASHLKKSGIAFEKVEARALESYFWKLKTEKNLSAASLFRKMEAIKSFYVFLVSDKKIEKSPAASFRSPKMPRRLPKTLSTSEIESLLRAEEFNTFEQLRKRVMLELIYATGMRASEILALKSDAINFQDGWVRALGKGSKERLIPIHSTAIAWLKRYAKAREARFPARDAAEFFLSRRGMKLSRVQFWREIRDLGKKAGISNLHPHLFRHSFATHLLQNGADLRSVQELLGHASLSTTEIYTSVDRSGLKKAHERFHPRP